MIHVSIFLFFFFSFPLQFSRTGSTMTSASLSDTRNRKLIAREVGKGEKEIVSPGCPLSSHHRRRRRRHLLSDPSRSRRRKRPRAKRGRFIWMRDASTWIAATFSFSLGQSVGRLLSSSVENLGCKPLFYLEDSTLRFYARKQRRNSIKRVWMCNFFRTRGRVLKNFFTSKKLKLEVWNE